MSGVMLDLTMGVYYRRTLRFMWCEEENFTDSIKNWPRIESVAWAVSEGSNMCSSLLKFACIFSSNTSRDVILFRSCWTDEMSTHILYLKKLWSKIHETFSENSIALHVQS